MALSTARVCKAYNAREAVTCVRVSVLIKLQVYGLQLCEKETLTPVFFCEFCKIFKNSISYGAVLVAASYVKVVFGQTQFEYIDRNSEV